MTAHTQLKRLPQRTIASRIHIASHKRSVNCINHRISVRDHLRIGVRHSMWLQAFVYAQRFSEKMWNALCWRHSWRHLSSKNGKNYIFSTESSWWYYLMSCSESMLLVSQSFCYFFIIYLHIYFISCFNNDCFFRIENSIDNFFNEFKQKLKTHWILVRSFISTKID